ncbi:plant expansin [Coniophora puteana RWD-64-598 SS2]|uniref:Plant expansin n=1 Tax=Coniophora puteana (strain RWD-64-598) TaxID=741705 RepID=R7SFV4_CONPW|nr:plant expansin [Coniophora puteana RWD-64-598 SS2]EIW74622.1 plant expansin [Coniophora puteana RWD-64-598 SS2]
MYAPITATWILPLFLSLLALLGTALGAPAPLVLPSEVDVKANANATATAKSELESRQYYSEQRLTYYEPGLGACGWESTADQWVVALSVDMYGSGGYCGQSVTINYNGNQQTATVVDECEACPYGGLDLSQGLFGSLAALEVGVIYGNWWFD